MIHVCVSPPTKMEKVRRKCPTCGATRTFLVIFYEWYGARMTCLACGDCWSDGEMLDRPFCRGWRDERVVLAKEKWARWCAERKSPCAIPPESP